MENKSYPYIFLCTLYTEDQDMPTECDIALSGNDNAVCNDAGQGLKKECKICVLRNTSSRDILEEISSGNKGASTVNIYDIASMNHFNGIQMPDSSRVGGIYWPGP